MTVSWAAQSISRYQHSGHSWLGELHNEVESNIILLAMVLQVLLVCFVFLFYMILDCEGYLYHSIINCQ